MLDSPIGKQSPSRVTDVDRVLEAAANVPLPIASREALYSHMDAVGFSLGLRQWLGSNLVPAAGSRGLRWAFNLEGVADMYRCACIGCRCL